MATMRLSAVKQESARRRARGSAPNVGLPGDRSERTPQGERGTSTVGATADITAPSSLDNYCICTRHVIAASSESARFVQSYAAPYLCLYPRPFWLLERAVDRPSAHGTTRACRADEVHDERGRRGPGAGAPPLTLPVKSDSKRDAPTARVLARWAHSLGLPQSWARYILLACRLHSS